MRKRTRFKDLSPGDFVIIKNKPFYGKLNDVIGQVIYADSKIKAVGIDFFKVYTNSESSFSTHNLEGHILKNTGLLFTQSFFDFNFSIHHLQKVITPKLKTGNKIRVVKTIDSKFKSILKSMLSVWYEPEIQLKKGDEYKIRDNRAFLKSNIDKYKLQILNREYKGSNKKEKLISVDIEYLDQYLVKGKIEII